MFTVFLFGVVFGTLGSIPVAGPISALVVTRGIQGRFRAANYIALGGALPEAVYAFLVFWGFSNFVDDYPLVQPISRGVAAVILLVLGVMFLRGKHTEMVSEIPPRDSAFGSFMLGVSICALNPALIATWTAVVTTVIGADAVEIKGNAIPFASGALLGILSWYFIVLYLIRKHRERFSAARLGSFLRVVGAALCIVALWFGFRFAQDMLQLSTARAAETSAAEQ